MGTNRPKCPNHRSNEKRSKAKLKRGFGKLAVKASGLSEIDWCRKRDPLYKIGGIERHKRLNQC